MDDVVLRRAKAVLYLWNNDKAKLSDFKRAVDMLHQATGAQILVTGGLYEIKNYAEGLVKKAE